jgi:hypothetical protein
MRNSKTRFAGRRVLSVFLWLLLIYHLFIIVLIPNRESFLNARIAPAILPYANFLNMNTAWQFFAPDPGPPIYLVAKVSQDTNVLAEEWYPPEKDEFRFRQFFNRRIATMRFLSKDPARAKQVLIPWLCTKYEKATTVIVERVSIGVPSIDSVRQGQPLNDLTGQHSEFFVSGDCERGELVE